MRGSSQISSVAAYCISQAETSDELDYYREIIKKQRKLLAERKVIKAFELVTTKAIAQLPDYADIIKSIHVFDQDKCTVDPYCATADNVPFYLWWDYDENVCCSIEWTGRHEPPIAMDSNGVKSHGDSMRKFPKRIVDFIYALRDAGINIEQRVQDEIKKK